MFAQGGSYSLSLYWSSCLLLSPSVQLSLLSSSQRADWHWSTGGLFLIAYWSFARDWERPWAVVWAYLSFCTPCYCALVRLLVFQNGYSPDNNQHWAFLRKLLYFRSIYRFVSSIFTEENIWRFLQALFCPTFFHALAKHNPISGLKKIIIFQKHQIPNSVLKFLYHKAHISHGNQNCWLAWADLNISASLHSAGVSVFKTLCVVEVQACRCQRWRRLALFKWSLLLAAAVHADQCPMLHATPNFLVTCSGDVFLMKIPHTYSCGAHFMFDVSRNFKKCLIQSENFCRCFMRFTSLDNYVNENFIPNSVFLS